MVQMISISHLNSVFEIFNMYARISNQSYSHMKSPIILYFSVFAHHSKKSLR